MLEAMGRINWPRVFLGGLLAGVVYLASGGVISLMFISRWNAWLETLGLEPQGFRPELGAGFFTLDCFIGIWIVWLYVSIRPRYGPGPKTALVAGLAVWVIFGIGNLFFVMLGVLPLGLTALTHACFLLPSLLCAVAGAWLYQEESG